MVMTVAVVIPKHSAMVGASQKMVDERQIVSGDFTVFIQPDLFANQPRPAQAASGRKLIDDLPQPSLQRHASSLPQLGHAMPYLICMTIPP